jgi:GcrA cell cycle regulator
MLDRVDGRQTIWNEAAVTDLKLRWSRGETASQISLGIPGTTRNSVLGKAHRLDLPVRANITLRTPRPPWDPNRDTRIKVPKAPKIEREIKATPKRAAPRVFAFRKQIPIRAKAAVPEFLGVPLLELAERACRYPQGEGPYLFCGQPSEPTSCYCSYHARQCFQVRT